PFFGIRGGMKWALDVAISTLALVLLAPLMLLIAAAIKWSSPGPLLCVQRRYGLDGKPVSIYRFRTTLACADPASPALLRDSRVTALGALLRRTSLDALPQFVNVLE